MCVGVSVWLGWSGIRVAGCSTASACNTDTTPTQPHRNSNTHRTKNNTTNVVMQRKSRKLLVMDILMSETCWAHKKWNKIASDVKLVLYSSTITMMHGPINIRLSVVLHNFAIASETGLPRSSIEKIVAKAFRIYNRVEYTSYKQVMPLSPDITWTFH